ncbi:MAG TPA: flagellar hook-length control protein FliK [Gammaproteobacteria bacterium]|nr:flagellar hook-length control protein FliK [Gammaproteobacteria bacterium]
MADPLLVLAANPEIAQGALRMGGNQIGKQLFEGETHPFAQLLAGHNPGPDEGLPLVLSALLAGNPQGQLPAVDGKELPDASRLLALAGFDLEDLGEHLDLPADDSALPSLPVGTSAEDLEEALQALLAGQEASAQAVAGTPVQVPGSLPDTASALARAALGGAGMPLADETAVPSGRPLIQSASSHQGPALPMAVTGEEAEALPLPEPARAVASAVHHVLQQRSLEEGARESRFGELMRAAATRGAEPGPRVETPAGLGPQAVTSPQAPAPVLPTTAVAVPLGQAGWDRALGEQVQWMVGNRLQGAEIRLNPAHLGPMEVRIQMQNDQANITFTAQHGVAREALEAAIPRLREMLGESGLQLNQVTVSDQSLAEQRRQDTQAFQVHRGASPAAGEPEEEPTTVTVTPLREGSGSIDYFA